ncbi:MAG: N-6 DNA methylase [Candidatus Omnitrophota bacterium]
MLDSETKHRIDTARDILVGKIPDPKSQVEQITIALIYKFMDDMDRQAESLPRGKAKFFSGEYKKYSWRNIFSSQNSGQEIVNLYGEALQNMNYNKNVPQLFRDIFKNAYLPYRDPETLKDFLKEINTFEYDHSECLGDAFEYLLSVLGSQGDAGQFRTPRHIIDFMIEIIEPKKNEKILDPACGTAGFLISAYKHIQKRNSKNYDPKNDPKPFELQDVKLSEITINGKGFRGEKLTSDDRKRLVENIVGYDISPDMVRLSLVNMYLHGFSSPNIAEYDTLSRDDKWDEKADVILANPPFMSPKGGMRPHDKFRLAQLTKRSEVLFVDYMAEHLTPNGRAAIIVPEGIIFQTGSAYKDLRKMLVDEKFLVGVISLPAGLFNPYSGVKTSILWLDKSLAKKTDKILFIKIENDGFDLGAQRRPIKKNDLPDAYQAIIEYKKCLAEKKDFVLKSWKNTSLVEREKMAKDGEYNLNGERYKVLVARSKKYPLVYLGDKKYFRIESGGTPDSKNKDYWNGNISWITLVDLPATDIFTNIQKSERTISEKGLKNSSAKLIPQNSIIVSTRATIGRVGINRIELATNQGFKNIIIEEENKVIPEYVAFIMTSLREKMKAMATGGTFKELSKTNFERLEIPLPPLSIQQEIVAELDSYQKIIDGACQVIEIYEQKTKDRIAKIWGEK